jgi:stage III sporulation protein AA
MMLRSMGPSCIAVDEITAEEDCKALIQAGWCGVSLLATAHAANKQDLLSRNVYRSIVDCGLFDTLLVMLPDKAWRLERMNL